MQQPVQQSLPQTMQQQQEQLAAQQLQQQMMLCPVRVVYETQILVQPGDQIQPNQTLFINPQNPPPWAQNRQVQNPVIYVQQMPNNIIPTVPQHIDQNQLFLQQYQNYQHMIPQQILSQEQRVQIPNIIPQNMIQNFQSNINPNIPSIPDRMQQTYPVQNIQNVGQAIQMQPQQQQQQVNIINNIKREPNTMPIVQSPQQTQPNSQRMEIKPGIFMNVGPQINQQPIRSSPQVLTVNPMQNIPQTNTNIQTMPPNLQRPIQTHSVGSQMSPPTFANANGQHMTRIRKVAPTTVNKVTNTNVGARGIGQSYRPIQPRPQQQFRPSAPHYANTAHMQNQQNKPMNAVHNVVSNLLPNVVPNAGPNAGPNVGPNTGSNAGPNTGANAGPNTGPNAGPNTGPNAGLNVGHNVTSNIINAKPTLPSMPSLQMTMPNPPIPYVKPEENTNTRKRKSESPDEIHKKMAAIQVNITTPIKPVTVPQRSIEVGVNTVPMQRVEQKPNISVIPKPIQTSNAETQIGELKQISKLVENVQQAIQIDRTNTKIQDGKEAPNIEKDKLIRNTVYTQARGRVLTDKETLIVTTENKITPKLEPSSAQIPPGQIPADNNNIKVENPITITSIPETIEEVKPCKRDMHDASISLNTANNKGMLPVDRTVKQEKDFVLTHVLDGIVIQESNIAFPIREPATRRFVQQNAQANANKNNNKLLEENIKEEEKPSTPVNDMPTLTEQQNEETVTKSDTLNNGDDPFSTLNQETVKLWTTAELSSYLTKHKWSETASLFLDHEIDGESLFLVSKMQLLAIGVKENHADVICCFVKS